MKNINKKETDPITAIRNHPLYEKISQEMDVLMKVAVEINVARVAIGITQQELAQKAKTTQKIISKIESGDYKAGITLLARITKNLGVSLLIGDSIISEQSVPQGVIKIMQNHSSENIKSISFNDNQHIATNTLRAF